MKILIDTGPIIALAIKTDQYHELCTRQIKKLNPPLLTCWPVITEAAWMLRKHPKEIQMMLMSIGSLFEILPLGNEAALGLPRFYTITKTSVLSWRMFVWFIWRKEKISTQFSLWIDAISPFIASSKIKVLN